MSKVKREIMGYANSTENRTREPVVNCRFAVERRLCKAGKAYRTEKKQRIALVRQEPSRTSHRR